MSDAQQLRVLIHKILLPRLRRLEEEVHSLRKHTWPYVQHMKERNQLDDMEMKVDFLRHLDDEGWPNFYDLNRNMQETPDFSPENTIP